MSASLLDYKVQKPALLNTWVQSWKWHLDSTEGLNVSNWHPVYLKYTAGDDQQRMASQGNSGSFPASAMYDTIKWKREGYD